MVVWARAQKYDLTEVPCLLWHLQLRVSARHWVNYLNMWVGNSLENQCESHPRSHVTGMILSHGRTRPEGPLVA